MKSKEEEVLHAFNHFWDTYAQRHNGAATIDDLKPLFAESVSSIGTGLHEVGRDLEQVLQNFGDDLKEVENPISLEYSYQVARLLSPTVGLVEAEALIILPMAEGPALQIYARFSTTFIEKDGRWLLSHNHISIPASEQDVGEAFPIDALRAKNNKLQELVTKRTQELEEKTVLLQDEKEKTERLLYNILPKKVAQELMSTGRNTPARHERVSVLFTDFKEFTRIASAITPKQLVAELNDIFYHFDDITKGQELEKIKTIGDSYMSVCGLPEADGEHAYKCVNAARQMLHFIEERNRHSPIQWSMRIGIHSGPVVAGVVGNHKFTYDLWGDTVNVASRLESASLAGKINISEQTYLLVKDRFPCEYRGKIQMKGKEEVDMYFVV